MFRLQRARPTTGRPCPRGSPERGRTRWTGEQSGELTLVAICRDVLRVVSTEERTDNEELGPVIEVDKLSQPLREVWIDESLVYHAMEHDHRTMLHDEE